MTQQNKNCSNTMQQLPIKTSILNQNMIQLEKIAMDSIPPEINLKTVYS